MTADIIAFAIEYGCYGYRGITEMLCAAGWKVCFNGWNGSDGVRG